MKKYIGPILILFVNTLTTTLYVSSDITILGVMTSDYYVGLYSIASKIYVTIKNILAAVIVVSIPRLSYFYGRNMIPEFKKLTISIINTLITTVLPAMVGLICISGDIIKILAGDEYLAGTNSLKILGVALAFSLFSWFCTSCILIPAKKEKKVLKATLCAAILNVVLNIVLVPHYKQNAAAITTVLAEIISFIICYYEANKVINIGFPWKNIIKTVSGCILIFLNCKVMTILCCNFSTFSELLIKIITSVIVYVVLELILKNEIIQSYIKIAKEKLSRKINTKIT